MAYAGTPIPQGSATIDSKTFPDLSIVAEWGRGTILEVAFVPASSSFIVASPFGFATYDSQRPDSPPTWTAFDAPFDFESLYFSADGKYILLEAETDSQVRTFPTGEAAPSPPSVEWLRATTPKESWGKISVTSPNGKLRLQSHSEPSEEWFEIEYSIREVYDAESGSLLYALPDETIQVSYEERADPEGCDLPVFAMDANALAPAAAHPYRAGFSSSGKLLAILYRAPNLWDTNRFSTLRVYDTSDGSVVRLIGSFQRPVETFAFSPQNDDIVVGFVDGTVEVWDPYKSTPSYSATHFTGPLVNMAYAPSGDFVVVQRPNALEVRRASDGAIRSRHAASAFAISPAADQLAIGSEEGTIQILDIASGETLQRIDAHTAEVYALAFSPDGRTLASSGEDCRVLAWDVETGALRHPYQENSADPYDLGESSRVFIYRLDFIPGTSRLIGFGSWGRVVGWDANSGATAYFFEPEPLEYYRGMITAKPHFPEEMRVDREAGLFHIGEAAYSLDTGENIIQDDTARVPPAGCAPVGPSIEDGDFLISVGYEAREGQLCLMRGNDLSLVTALRILDVQQPGDVIVIWPVLSPNDERLLLPLTYGATYVAQVDRTHEP